MYGKVGEVGKVGEEGWACEIHMSRVLGRASSVALFESFGNVWRVVAKVIMVARFLTYHKFYWRAAFDVRPPFSLYVTAMHLFMTNLQVSSFRVF